MYLLGDLNCNMLNKSNLSQRMCDEYQLTQHIKEPTWITNNLTTCIELVYSSYLEKISQSGLVPIGFSDHDMQFVVRTSTMPKREARQVQITNYKNYNVQSFNGYLWLLPWSVINVFEDPQVMWDIFVLLFTEAADKHAPWIHKRIKGRHPIHYRRIEKTHVEQRYGKSQELPSQLILYYGKSTRSFVTKLLL